MYIYIYMYIYICMYYRNIFWDYGKYRGLILLCVYIYIVYSTMIPGNIYIYICDLTKKLIGLI